MFEWLDDELLRICTPKFHVVDGPVSHEFRELIVQPGDWIPESYKTFVLRYGNAKLYRKGLLLWLIEVYAGPREAADDNGAKLFQVARTDTSLAYCRESLLVGGRESPIIEWHHGRGLHNTHRGFKEWLTAKSVAARKRYTKEEWAEIEGGPAPFSPEEMAIMEARRHFQWRVVGVAPTGDLQFEVHNGSNRILSYLTIGIRGRLRPPASGPLEGAVRLFVGSISPGEAKVVAIDAYKDLVAPEDVQAFPLPEPGPEDRHFYWELKASV